MNMDEHCDLLGVTTVCTKSFSQPRSTTWQGEEHIDSSWKVEAMRVVKGVASSTKMDFMRILNDLDWEQPSLEVLWSLAL